MLSLYRSQRRQRYRPELVARRVERPTVEALAPTRYKVQFTASVELQRQARAPGKLVAFRNPGGDVAAAIDYAVTQTLQRLEARRFGKTPSPERRWRQPIHPVSLAPSPRRCAVRVHVRDGGRCRFVDEHGRRCSERHRLEFHHRHPFGLGGDHSPGNISLLCRRTIV
jgi:hypothetical protein